MSDAARITAWCVLSLLLSSATDTASAALGASGETPSGLRPATSGIGTLQWLLESAGENTAADTPFLPPKPESRPLPEPTVPDDLACSPGKA